MTRSRLVAFAAATMSWSVLLGCVKDEPTADPPPVPTAAESKRTTACNSAARADVRRAGRLFFEQHTLSGGYVDGITAHGISRDDAGWFLLVLVAPSEGETLVRERCFHGVRVEYEQGGPFTAD